jgi:hypothetical protein
MGGNLSPFSYASEPGLDNAGGHDAEGPVVVDIPPGAVRSASVWVAREAQILEDVGKSGKEGTGALSELEGCPGGIQGVDAGRVEDESVRPGGAVHQEGCLD